MTTRWARFARGWVAAAISVFVALCSHLLAGGTMPGLPGIALCLAFAGMVCIALSGKSLSLPRLALSVSVSQFLFHAAFSILGGAVPSTITTVQSTSMTGMDMDGHPLQIAPVVSDVANGGMSMPDWMWAAHAVAAVVTILALRFGERAFWQLLALARPFVVRLFGLTVVAPDTRPVRRPIESPRPALRSAVAFTRMRHRGPPAAAAL